MKEWENEDEKEQKEDEMMIAVVEKWIAVDASSEYMKNSGRKTHEMRRGMKMSGNGW